MAFPPELSLFSQPPPDVTHQRIQYIEYNSTSQLNSGAITFNIPASANQYIDLRRTRLCLKVKITKGNGSPLEKTEKVAPINLFAHTLMEHIDLQLQQELVSDSASQSYGYKAYIETILQHGSAAQETYLQAQCFFRDTAGFFDSMEITREGNLGFAERYALFSESKIVDMESPLLLGICQQPKFLLNGVDIQLKMYPARPEFCLMSPTADANYRPEIVQATLRVCKVLPTPEILLAHAETLREHPAEYLYKRSELRTFQISAGMFSFNLEDVFQSQIPNKIVVGFVKSSSYGGSYQSNPLNFSHFDLNQLTAYVDDVSVPGKPLRFSFPNANYLEGYMSLFDNPDDDDGSDPAVPYISRLDYPMGNALMAFSLAPNMPTSTVGNVKLAGVFDKPLPENVTVIIYADFNSLLKLDNARNVMI